MSYQIVIARAHPYRTTEALVHKLDCAKENTRDDIAAKYLAHVQNRWPDTISVRVEHTDDPRVPI